MRIGLIAMSGVRCCDAELLQLGLTLPGFVERSQTIASLPSLGLLTLAALTPAHHEVAYREVDELPPTDQPLEPFDLVAISTFTAQVCEAYALADRYRAQGVPVVMGGLHVTTLPNEALAHCDAVVVGEGETVWQQVVADAEAHQLHGIYRAATRGMFDLANAPVPRYELLDIEKYNRLTVQTSRGCPWQCTFCASSILLTDRYKQKPMERVLAEVDRICALWPRPFVELADDNSFVNHRYWKALLPELARRHEQCGLRWFTETDISVANDDQLLALLRGAGCMEVLIGLESPEEFGLRGLEMKRDWKRQQLQYYEQAVRRVQSHGIRVNGCFIVGLDGHDAGVFERVERFAEKLELFDVQITLPTPFPGTSIYKQWQQAGRLLEDEPWPRCTLFDVTFEPAQMSVDELQQGFRELTARLYSDAAMRRRRSTFKDTYLRTARRGSRAAQT